MGESGPRCSISALGDCVSEQVWLLYVELSALRTWKLDEGLEFRVLRLDMVAHTRAKQISVSPHWSM